MNGDVWTRVNEIDLASAEDALAVYSKIREVSHLEILVRRNGESIPFRVELQ